MNTPVGSGTLQIEDGTCSAFDGPAAGGPKRRPESSRISSACIHTEPARPAATCEARVEDVTRLPPGAMARERPSTSPRSRSSASERTIDIFLDRPDLPLPVPNVADRTTLPHARDAPTVYAALLAFLRTGTFPPLLSIPQFETNAPTSDSSAAFASEELAVAVILREHPALVLAYLGTFQTIKTEARWLGLRTAERACDDRLSCLRRLASAEIGTVNNPSFEVHRAPDNQASRVQDGWI